MLSDEDGTIHYLFFKCYDAKYVWGVVSKAVGANTGPRSFITKFLAPAGK
jgi:hypothetical protein